MKKLFSLVLVLCLVLSSSALALNYKMHLDNEATFETMEEARVNGPIYMASAVARTYVADPCMDEYPVGTTYVYRSANLYTPLSAAPRMNANILVYTDKAFESKDEAKAYLDDLGLIDIIDEAYGSIVLVTPINPAAGFGLADQYAFYLLQCAQCNVNFYKAGDDGVRNYYADSVYYGGLTYRYAIGIDGGATFLNNYIVESVDFASRLAAMLLIGGVMEDVSFVASPVPAYLVNPTAHAVAQYKAGNETDTWGYEGDVDYYFNQALPLQKVCVETAEEVDLKDIVTKVYNNFMVKYMRNAVYRKALYTAGTKYANYNWNQAPYSLAERNAFYTGKTEGGLVVIERCEDRFAEISNAAGEYLQTWYEILPEEVLDGTAEPGSIPLVLANHGGGDDVMQFIDEFGILALAEDERFAIVAAYHSDITYINNLCLPALVEYMLETYPALDASRVYATGYSMGGMASMAAAYGNARMFAACVPMAFPFWNGTEDEIAALNEYGMPFLAVISSHDDFWYEWGVGIKSNYQQYINAFMGFNGMEEIVFDFETYPMSGFKADSYERKVLNGEYANHTWLMNNEDGIPMVGLNCTEYLPHGLWQEYAKIAWDFSKHYSRDLETGAIIYTK